MDEKHIYVKNNSTNRVREKEQKTARNYMPPITKYVMSKGMEQSLSSPALWEKENSDKQKRGDALPTSATCDRVKILSTT